MEFGCSVCKEAMSDSFEISDLECELIVAMHEAGHAVACCRCDVPFSHVSIDCDGAGGGVYTVEVCRPDKVAEFERHAARCRAQAIVAFAGPLAELKAARCGITPAVGLSSGRKDERDARHFVREMIEVRRGIAEASGEAVTSIEELPGLLVAELGVLHSEAMTLIEENFPAIEKVARKLADAGRLSVDEIKQALR